MGGRCGGRAGCAPRCKSLQSKKAEIKGQGELQGALENLGDASINASSFQVYAWDQRCVIV